MSTRKRPPEDFADEVRTHLEIETHRLIEDGADPEAAAHAARRAFGSVALAHERFYESQRWMWLDRLRQDVRGAVRTVTRYPLASCVAILSLAAGIGVATTTLTVRNALFHNPPPEYADPVRLSEIAVARGTQPMMPIGSRAPGGLVADWIAAIGPSAIAAARPGQGVRDVRTGDRLESVPVRAVTAESFDVLGITPAAGRTFGATRGSSRQAMLSYRFWQQWFDGRPDAIGQTIWIENTPHVIVGVLPARFWLSDMLSAVWTVLDRDTIDAEEGLDVIVRRPPGMSHAGLRQVLEPVMARYGSRQPADRRQLRMSVGPVEGTPMGRQMPLLLPWALGVAALLTVLIACANVAVLMIAQWTAREHEISIRASIGASRGRLVRALLVESLVLALCGGTIGVAVTLMLRALLTWRSGAAQHFDLSIRPAVFLQIAAITFAAGILTGLAPALFETRRLYGNPMRVSTATEPIRQRWRHALVVAEIGVTVALLVLTATFLQSYRRGLDADVGFATRPLMSAAARNPKGVPVDIVIASLQRLPGVSGVAAATSAPYTAVGERRAVAADDGGATVIQAERGEITQSFFAALGVQLLAGRAFDVRDAVPNARVAIVNDALARRLFGAAEGVGRTVWIDGVAHDVVGVVANFSNSQFFRNFEARVFVPLRTTPAPDRAIFVVRASSDPLPLVQPVRRAIRDAAPGTIVTRAFTFDTIRTIGSQEALLGTAPLFPLITIGLLLTTTGIYGVLAFSIARRARELAVRLAIGASGRDLAWLVAGSTARLVAIGAGLGIFTTFVLSRIVRAAGGAGSWLDAEWPSFVVALVMISAVALLAAWVPTRRSQRIDPALLLRST
jgi:putative ABC transport system permease protein